MNLPPAIAEVLETIAIWLNPKRRELVILRKAIEAAEQLLALLRREGRYAKMTDAKRAQYEIHFQRQFDAWRDGQT